MKDFKGRDIVSGAPTTEWSERGLEVRGVQVAGRTEAIVEETDTHRIIVVTETVQVVSGVTNYDPSGSWGGGGVDSEHENTYTVREQKGG